MAETRYNSRSPAVKRLLREAAELHEPTRNYFAQPLEENLFEWHFTIRGPDDTPFSNGIYHGRIILPPAYPMKPPNVIFTTPNGRFETHKKICLSISGYHPETWRPSWSIRTALLALIGFFPTHGNGAIGSLDYTEDERKKLAIKSKNHKCDTCGAITELLLDEPENKADKEEIQKLGAELVMSKPKDDSTVKESAPTETIDPNDNVDGETVSEEASLDPMNSDSAPTTPLTVEDIAPIPAAAVTPAPRNADDMASFVLQWFLVFLILGLVYRRLHTHFGLDLIEIIDSYFSSLLPY